MKGLKHGIYRIHWITGGSSLASVGYTHDGSNWYAPCNWTSKDNSHPIVASTDWSQVSRYDLLIEHNYDESESPSADQAGEDEEYLLDINRFAANNLYKSPTLKNQTASFDIDFPKVIDYIRTHYTLTPKP